MKTLVSTESDYLTSNHSYSSDSFCEDSNRINNSKQLSQDGISEYNEDLNSSNYRLTENLINNQRIEYLEKMVSPLFITLLKYDEFEFGTKGESVKLMEEHLKINTLATITWFKSLYLHYFANDDKILIGILKVIDALSLENEAIQFEGKFMAMAALLHKNNEIKELGVRIFENNCSFDNYNILRNIHVETKWLQDYINQVKVDFKKELCL